MSTRQDGFTLVEFLVVAVLTAVILGATYQTLIVQERSFDAAKLIMHDQESMRTATGILESELREVGSIGGAAIGGSDIIVAASDSIVFRAQRKVGIVCDPYGPGNWIDMVPLGEDFASQDTVLLFVDGNQTTATDDDWDHALVKNAQTTSSTNCATQWPGVQPWRLTLDDLTLSGANLGAHPLTGVQEGALVRAYETVTYTLRSFPREGWGLARIRSSDPQPTFLVGGLASATDDGLEFQYFTPTGTATNDPTQVARVEITVRTDPGTPRVGADSMTTTMYLRNN